MYQHKYRRYKNPLTVFPDLVQDVRCNWSKVAVRTAAPDANGCERWLGGSHRQGYGMIGCYRLSDGANIMHTVHRLIAKHKYKSDLKGFDCIHTCGNMWCVAAAHIAVGTTRDVIQAAIQRDPTMYTRPRRGSPQTGPRNQHYKYGIDTILAIKTGTISIEEFSVKFNLDLEWARVRYYHIKTPGSYKWAQKIIRERKLVINKIARTRRTVHKS